MRPDPSKYGVANAMNAAPSRDPHDAAPAAQLISSLADGELHERELEDGCTRWRQDEAARRTWHAYHLIGDVMRSEDLASTPVHDAEFVRRLRARLAGEPALLAPAPLPRRGAPARRWLVSAAAFGGVAVVAGAVALNGGFGTAGDDGTRLAARATAPMQRVGAPALPASAQRLQVDGKLIRDARLDAYFEAHRGAVGGMPSALPGGGALRSVDVIVQRR